MSASPRPAGSVPLEIVKFMERGAMVFPFAPNSKTHPLVQEWQINNNTDDPTDPVLLEIVQKNPDCNWASNTGQRFGQFMIDIDCHDETRAGFRWLEARIREHGPGFTKTLKVRSWSGGLHLHYAYPQGWWIKNTNNGELAPGVDTRGERGCAIMPPSRINGRAYTFEDCDATSALQYPPDWLLEELERQGCACREPLPVEKPEKREPAKTESVNDRSGKIVSGKGERHAVFKREAIRLVRARINCAGLLAHFLDINQNWFVEPYPVEEVHRQAESWYDWVRKNLFVEEKDGFNLVTLSNLFVEPEVAVEYVVDGLLVAGTVSGVFAKPKVGKSTFARNLCLAVARGTRFLGKPTRQGLCLYLALEERKQDVISDFRAMGATGAEPIEVHAGPAPIEAIGRICELARERRPVLLVVDPLFRATRVKDEGSYAELYNAIGPFIDVGREVGTHIHFTHHAGKAAKDDPIDSPLGSTGIGATVNSMIILKRGKVYRTLETRQRVYRDMEETVVQFDEEHRILSLGETKEKADEIGIGQKILRTLEGMVAGLTEGELLEGTEGDTGLKRRALRKLVDEELVYRQGSGKRGSPFRYFLVSRLLTIEKDERRESGETLTDEKT